MKKLIFIVILFINGCVTAPEFVIETPDKDQTRVAKSEILRKGNIYTNSLSKNQKLSRLGRVEDRLKEPARRLCLALGERSSNDCNWEVYYHDEPEINAFAREGEDGNEVVIFMGVLDHTHSDEELAFVVAHEISHHILNHIGDDGFTIGEFIGILAGLAIIGDDDYDEDSVTLEDMTDLIGLTKTIGGAFDRPQFSRSQESEADFLSIQILDDAGYSLSKAKQGLINISASAEDTSSRPAFLGTHPSGPQRLAIFNNNMKPSSRSKLASKIYSWCLEQSSWMQQNYNCNQYLKVKSANSQERKPTAKERSGFDWDHIYSNGEYIWMCREIKTRQIWSDVNCNGIPKKDDRWPALYQ